MNIGSILLLGLGLGYCFAMILLANAIAQRIMPTLMNSSYGHSFGYSMVVWLCMVGIIVAHGVLYVVVGGLAVILGIRL